MYPMKRIHSGAAVLAIVVLACGPREPAQRAARADFSAAPGYQLSGKASLREVAGGVVVSVQVEHAPPGKKGIHVHQKSDCSDIPGRSMGEHFSPEVHQHGLPSSVEHHLGDLGNIEIAAGGTGELEVTIPGANLKPGDSSSFLGRAIVIHAQEDVGTPPSGNSGSPIACAAIGPD